MKVAVLTSSRADYGIYKPLLSALHQDIFFELNVIAFGTHPSKLYGETINLIQKDGFPIADVVESLVLGDSPEAISTAMGLTQIRFTDIWKKGNYDLIIALGDRYEMYAAALASIPFGIKIAHIHGGETTLGAIDNVYRHGLSLMSEFHFTVAEPYKQKVISLIDSEKHVYNVGALSFDSLRQTNLLSKEQITERFKVNVSDPFLLITFHPETVSYQNNEVYITELLAALNELEGYNYIITMPNADTMGNLIREKIVDYSKTDSRVFCVENFGQIGYLSVMSYCSLLLGNTSSGFGEASWFPKKVVNLGDRQKGRLKTPNIVDCVVEKRAIIEAVKKAEGVNLDAFESVYGNGFAAEKIISILKNEHGN